MGQSEESHLLEAAIGGDRAAVGRLLMRHDARLRTRIAGWIPPEMGPLLSVEDVLQDTYTEAYRHISSFDADKGFFHAWLAKIAERRFLNARRWLLAGKRDLKRQAKGAAAAASSFVELVCLVGEDGGTPSRRVRQSEAARFVQVALAGLKEDYRKALWMRYIEGRPIKTIAEAMGRTEGAVRMLCNRGLHALRESMGSASRFLSGGG